jgi:hypothetical protein
MNCSCDALPTQICSLAIGLASGAKASPANQWIVRYSEYFLREQEGTSLAIAAPRLCKLHLSDLGPLRFGLGLGHDDQSLAFWRVRQTPAATRNFWPLDRNCYLTYSPCLDTMQAETRDAARIWGAIATAPFDPG